MIYDVKLNFNGSTIRTVSDGKIVDIAFTRLNDGQEAGLHLTKEEFYSLIRAFMFIDTETDKKEDDE